MIALVAFAGIMCAVISNNASARRKGTSLNKFDRILYSTSKIGSNQYKCGNKTIALQRGEVSLNYDLNCIEYYQPIEQEYALGYMIATNNVNHMCSNEIYGDKLSKVKSSGKSIRASLVCSNNLTHKSSLAYMDHPKIASYMGTLYDVREYFWLAYRGYEPAIGFFQNCPAVARVSDGRLGTFGGECYSGIVKEFHFYPAGTLNFLDNLRYDPEGDATECDEETQVCDTCKETTITDLDPVTGKSVKKKIKKCTYDEYAYRGADGKIIYTGSYRDKITDQIAEQDGYILTAKGYEEYLIHQEDSIKLTGQAGSGVFKGIVYFNDIDDGGEAYNPTRGVKSLYTTATSNVSPTLTAGGKAHTYVMPLNPISYFGNYPWYRELCPKDVRENSPCKYTYHGSEHSDSANPNTSLWMAFESKSSEPFTVVYQTFGGWGSSVGAWNAQIAYVITDDMSGAPAELQGALEEFQREYKEIYGKELTEDDFIMNNGLDASKVLRKAGISLYSDYNPYFINKLLEDMGANELKWYNCPELNDECEIPREKTDGDNEKKVNRVTYYWKEDPENPGEGAYYDFLTTDKIYYTSLSDILGVNFKNTCYSGNISTSEVENAE